MDDQARTLWVGNLADSVTEEILYELFLQAGPLSKVTIPKDKDGRPRRFGFVVFKHDASVPYTLKLMANTRLYNRELHLRAREVRTSQNTSDIDSPRSQDSDQSQGSSGNFRSPRDQVYQNSRNFNPDRDDLRSSLQRSNTCPGNIDHMMPRSRRGHNQSGYGSGGNDRYSNQQSSGMYSGNSEGKVNTSDPLLTLDAPCMSTSEVVNPSALDMEIKRQRLMQQQDIMLDTNRQRQPRHHDQSYAPYSRGRSDSRYADDRRNRRY